MGAFRTLFTERHTFFPVIHVHRKAEVLRNADFRQMFRNIDIAESCGADGVFLIGHGGVTNVEMAELYLAARQKHPEFWIGLNFLQASNALALSIIPDITCGLWSDHAGITDTSEDEAKAFAALRKNSPWNGLYFGGIAFKGQEPVHDLAAVAKRAVPFMDVLTTSGEATGIPPSPQKIATIKNAADEHPVAVASGMRPDNVSQYLMADCFLVSTGVSKSAYDLDPELVLEFENKLDHSAYEPPLRQLAS